MLLVIFGAGASYDCLPEGLPYGEWRLPLTQGVFDLGRPEYARIAGLYEGSTGIMDRVSKAIRLPRATLEGELAKIVASAKTDPELEIGLLAVQYYLRRLFYDSSAGVLGAQGKLTNYARFVWRLEDWRAERNERTTYVTFNYDTLLDAALRQRGALSEWGDYVRPHRGYFKVHGSVDWEQQAEVTSSPTLRDAQSLIWGASTLKRRSNMDAWRIRQPVQDAPPEEEPWLPALALPVEDKDELLMPPMHLESLKDSLTQVTRVLTFGWKARESEFMKLLGRVPSGVPVYVLTKSTAGAAEAAENLRMAGLDGPTTKAAMGFEEFVNDGHLPELLTRI